MGGLNCTEFEHIFDTWYEPIRNFLYYKAGDIKAAEDLTQDVFLKIWEKRSEIRLETIRPFLYKLANNMFLNRQDHLKVELKFVVDFQSGVNNESPEFQLELNEFDTRLQKAINGLDEKKRTVFLMNRIEKLTYAEIAESIGITVKAVEKRMEKALAYMKNQIEVNI
jgi:RNA polymerase sigma-70 factor (family 1)